MLRAPSSYSDWREPSQSESAVSEHILRYVRLKGVDNASKDRSEQDPLNCVIGGPMPSLDPLAQSPDCIDVFERAVQKTGAIASFIRRSCCAEQDVREDPIQCGGPAITHRAFN